MALNQSFVYALLDPADGSCRYIGKANDPAARLEKHICNTRLTSRKLIPVELWIHDLSSPPVLEVVSQHSSEAEAFDAEMNEIQRRREKGCDLLNVVCRGAPRKMTAETKQRLSEAARRRWQNPEWRAKFLATRSKRRLTPEHRAKLSAIKKGSTWSEKRRRSYKPPSPEQRQRMSAAAKGRPWSDARRAAQDRRSLPC